MVNLRAIPIHMAPGSSPIQKWHEYAKKLELEKKGSDVAGLSSSLKTGKAMLQRWDVPMGE